MKLHWSPRSPFVRKVMIAAHERGLVDRLELVRTVVAMNDPNEALGRGDNPLSKIPVLVLDDGTPVFDSRVILEYLDDIGDALRLLPHDPAQRLIALRRQALGDGFLDVLLLWRNERDRPEAMRAPAFLQGYEKKYSWCMEALEREAPALRREPFSVGQIALGCALSYLDFRFAHLKWRDSHPAIHGWHRDVFESRASFKATEVVDDSN